MYKAIIEIGGYKPGEEVPAEKAELWLKMYKFPPVKKIDDQGKSESEEIKESEPEKEDKSDPEDKSKKHIMSDDYLGRNTNVVKKNVEDDDLSKDQLNDLLELEKSDKKRKVIIQAINKKLKN